MTFVNGSTDATGIIDFTNQPRISYSVNFIENAVSNNGTLDGYRVATLTGDTFKNAGSTILSPTSLSVSPQ